MLTIGDFELYSIITGTIALDGGAMYGVVPKVLWSKVEEVDELNRIRIAMRTLLAVNKKAGRVIIVDGGAGDKWPQDELERYDIETRPTAILDALRALCFSKEDVTDVILTHLHFDHVGGFSSFDEEGDAKPTFPNANHWIHEGHWRHANNPTERDRASFLKRDLAFLHSYNLLKFVSGDPPNPTIAGIEWFVSNGHTPCMLLPIFKGTQKRSKIADDGHEKAADTSQKEEGRDLMFTGDLIPNANQLNPAWSMSYDLFPLTIVEERKRVLTRCLETGMLLAFPHDMKMSGASVTFNGKRYHVKEPLLF